MTYIHPYGEMNLQNMSDNALGPFSEKLWIEGNGPGWEIVRQEWIRRDLPDVPERIEEMYSPLKPRD